MSSTSQLSSFTLFPSLPIELRHEIYKLTIQPRLVQILRRYTTIPALLHTCRESRNVMRLAGYELAFRDADPHPFIWYNFQYDILYLDYEEELEHLKRSKDCFRVERLAVGQTLASFKRYLKLIPVFQHLTALLFVLQQFIPTDTEQDEVKYIGMPECMGCLGCMECIQFMGRLERMEHMKRMERMRRMERMECMECDGVDLMDPDATRHWGRTLHRGYQQSFANHRLKGGSLEDFFPLHNAAKKMRLVKDRDDRSGDWSIPEIKHVFVVSKEFAATILWRREQFWEARCEAELEAMAEHFDSMADQFDEDNEDAIKEMHRWS